MHTSARYHASRGADAMLSQRYNRLDFFGHCPASIADDAMILRRCRGFYNIGRTSCARSEFNKIHCIENEIRALHLYCKEYPTFKKRSALQCGHAKADAKAETGIGISDAGCQIV